MLKNKSFVIKKNNLYLLFSSSVGFILLFFVLCNHPTIATKGKSPSKDHQNDGGDGGARRKVKNPFHGLFDKKQTKDELSLLMPSVDFDEDKFFVEFKKSVYLLLFSVKDDETWKLQNAFLYEKLQKLQDIHFIFDNQKQTLKELRNLVDEVITEAENENLDFIYLELLKQFMDLLDKADRLFTLNNGDTNYYYYLGMPKDCLHQQHKKKSSSSKSSSSLLSIEECNSLAILHKCLPHIVQIGQEEIGIYRTSGHFDTLKFIQEHFQNERNINDNEFQNLDKKARNYATVAQIQYNLLHDSIMRDSVFKDWESFAIGITTQKLRRIEQEERNHINQQIINLIKHTIKKLEIWQRTEFEFILFHLNYFSKFSEITKMTISNLAVVFAPSLLGKESDAPMMKLAMDLSEQRRKERAENKKVMLIKIAENNENGIIEEIAEHPTEVKQLQTDYNHFDLLLEFLIENVNDIFKIEIKTNPDSFNEINSENPTCDIATDNNDENNFIRAPSPNRHLKPNKKDSSSPPPIYRDLKPKRQHIPSTKDDDFIVMKQHDRPTRPKKTTHLADECEFETSEIDYRLCKDVILRGNNEQIRPTRPEKTTHLADECEFEISEFDYRLCIEELRSLQ